MKKFDFRIMYHIFLIVMLGFFMFAVIFTAVSNRSPAMDDKLYKGTADLSGGWLYADGSAADLSDLKNTEDIVGCEEFSVFNTLPEDTGGEYALFFKSNHVFFSVYINGEEVYTPTFSESPFYTKSPGTRQNCIPVPKEYRGGNIEIRIKRAYPDGNAFIDHIEIGSSGGIILHTLRENLLALITCLLLLFVGVMLIVADIPINIGSQKNHELFYLGLLALVISMWCLSETDMLQFIFDDSKLLKTVSCCLLMLIPIPMILYLEAAFGFSSRWLVPSFCTLSAVEYVVCWILQLTGIADVHQTLTLTHVMLILCSGIFLYTVAKYYFFNEKSRELSVYNVLRGLGICSLAVSAVIDLARFYKGAEGDSALYVRIGLLIFILCCGSSGLESTVNAVKLGVKTEFISRLAYQDGLTGIGNRTAFEEELAAKEKKWDDSTAVGIVMFDVNDLKFVNDNLGHHLGDSMIMKSAEIISSAFAPEGGRSFRIGGDEFAVIFSGYNMKSRYEKGMDRFLYGVGEYNNSPDKEFRLSIAHGFAMYEKGSAYSGMTDVYNAADKRMYENKKIIKANQETPREYYSAEGLLQ